jgi:hypothetical protein
MNFLGIFLRFFNLLYSFNFHIFRELILLPTTNSNKIIQIQIGGRQKMDNKQKKSAAAEEWMVKMADDGQKTASAGEKWPAQKWIGGTKMVAPNKQKIG